MQPSGTVHVLVQQLEVAGRHIVAHVERDDRFRIRLARPVETLARAASGIKFGDDPGATERSDQPFTGQFLRRMLGPAWDELEPI